MKKSFLHLLKNKYVRKSLEFLVLALSFVFIGRYLLDGWPQLVAHIHHVKWSYIFYGLTFFWAYFLLRATAWWLTLRRLDSPLPFAKACYIWFISEFSRYIPGNVWSFVGRVYLCDKEKISKRMASLSLLLEIFYLVGASLALGLVFFFTGSTTLQLPLWSLIIILPIVITIINPKILGRLIDALFFKWKKDHIKFSLNFSQSIFIFLLYIAAWLAYGFASYLIADAFVDLHHVSTLWLTCSFVLAWAIGYLSFLTPMGLGVREAAIVGILKNVISSTLASLVALTTRIFMIIAELTALGLIFLVKEIKTRSLFPKAKNYYQTHRASCALAAMILVYVAYFLTVSCLKHSNYLTSRYDLGNMAQTVWNTAHGHFFELTNPEIGIQISRFSIHGDIFLVLLAPIYWLFSSPYTLLVIQTVVISLGALPIFWLAKDILKNNKLALAIAFSYLMFPGTQWANIFDFHSVALATSFLVYTFYFAYKKKYIPFFLFALLALSTKETIAFSLVLIALYIIFVQKNWKIGTAIGALSIAWFGLLLYKIMPEARHFESSHFALGYYSYFGDGPTEIIKNAIFHPTKVIDYLQTNSRWYYFIMILAPTGFLALLSPLIIFALPAIAINVFSSESEMQTIFYHYTSDIAPFLFLSMIFGLHFLLRILPKKVKIKGQYQNEKFWAKLALIYIIFVTLNSSIIWSPLPLFKSGETQAFTYRNPAKQYLDELSHNLPSHVSISATNRISPHFANRQINYMFPNGINQADYIIVESDYEYEQAETPKEIIKLKSNPNYEKIYSAGTVTVYRKK